MIPAAFEPPVGRGFQQRNVVGWPQAGIRGPVRGEEANQFYAMRIWKLSPLRGKDAVDGSNAAPGSPSPLGRNGAD